MTGLISVHQLTTCFQTELFVFFIVNLRGCQKVHNTIIHFPLKHYYGCEINIFKMHVGYKIIVLFMSV